MLFAKGLDEMSYLFMGTQKKNPKSAAATWSVQEYVRMEGGDDPRIFFKNPGYMPDIQFHSPIKRRKYNTTKFQFESSEFSYHAANKTVHGRFYERHGEPDAPLLILLHGWRMDSYMLFDKYCRFFVKEGFNVAMPDLPYHMNRTPGGSFAGEYTFMDDGIHTMEALRQALFDVMAIMNWAREKRGVTRVGIMGVSFGALLTGLLACSEPSIDFAVMVAPPVDLGRMFSMSRLGKVFESENPRAEKMLRVHRDTLSKVALQNLKPVIPSDRIFIAEGKYDQMVPPELIEELWVAWDYPELGRYPQGHLSVIMFNDPFEKDMKCWLRKKIVDHKTT